jgi:DNA-nicking Smr family endonuclease
MSKKNPPSDQDIFNEAMKNVSPLKKTERIQKDNTKMPEQHKKQKQQRAQQFESEAIKSHYSEGHSPYKPVMGDEIIEFHHGSLNKQTFNALKKGFIEIDANLDLHSLTVAEAEQHLQRFLFICQQKNLYCVIIIHGKGHLGNLEQPTLKNFVNDYLRHDKNVLAFHSAKPRHGGTGAVYALLQSNQKEASHDE